MKSCSVDDKNTNIGRKMAAIFKMAAKFRKSQYILLWR